LDGKAVLGEPGVCMPRRPNARPRFAGRQGLATNRIGRVGLWYPSRRLACGWYRETVEPVFHDSRIFLLAFERVVDAW